MHLAVTSFREADVSAPISPRPLSRREFMWTAAASAGGLLAACAGEDRPGHPTAPLREVGAAAGRNPLRVPAAVSVGGLTLVAQPGTADLGGGRTTAAWLYNGQLPGPTLVAQRGERATIQLVNGLAQPSITHWHGMLVDHPNDGHPQQARPPGGIYPYDFTVNQRAGLNWYHPHPHMTTGGQVYRGLAGAFVVRDTQDTGAAGNPLGLPYGPYELPLIIRDASFDSAGNLTFGNKASGFFGGTPLVNGTLAPYLAVDRAVYRFRVLNGCNARVLRLSMGAGGPPLILIGTDGGLLGSRPVALAEITLAPGERVDLLVDLRSVAPNASLLLRDLASGWELLELRATGGGTGNGGVPTVVLSTVPLLTSPVRNRQFSFDGMSRLNGKTYDPARLDFRVPFGQTERWVFRTNGNGPHPVHVHGASFQVRTRVGGRGRVYAWERGWKDTVLVHDGETVEVLIRFTSHRGLYVIHCHQLAHEDNGMMANFQVF